jgi:TolB-like protein
MDTPLDRGFCAPSLLWRSCSRARRQRFFLAMTAHSIIQSSFERTLVEGIGQLLPGGSHKSEAGDLSEKSPCSGRTVRVVGERCRALRTQLGLSREALAELAHGPDALSIATIKRAELGHAIYPGSAAALARMLGTSLEELLHFEGHESPATAVGQAAVAVLPFRAIDGDQESARFAEGLAADVIHRLASFWFPVIARASSFRVGVDNASHSEIGSQLGADYLVDGSIRASDKRIRVVASLFRASDGHQVWVHSYDSQLADVLTLQSELATDIGSEVGATLLSIEGARYAATSPRDLNGWALGLRSAWHLHRLNAADNREARACAERALSLDRRLALPRYVTVLSHQHDLVNQWATDPRGTLQKMVAASIEFERSSPGDPLMLVASAYASVATGEHEDACARLEAALERDANSARAHSLYGQVLAMRGQAEQALHELDLARTLSPRDPALWTMLLATALAHFVAERYEQASTFAKQAILERPEAPFNYGVLAASQALAGDLSAAKRTVLALRDRGASLTVQAVQPIIGSTDPHIVDRFVDGLRRAGVKAER